MVEQLFESDAIKAGSASFLQNVQIFIVNKQIILQVMFHIEKNFEHTQKRTFQGKYRIFPLLKLADRNQNHFLQCFISSFFVRQLNLFALFPNVMVRGKVVAKRRFCSRGGKNAFLELKRLWFTILFVGWLYLFISFWTRVSNPQYGKYNFFVFSKVSWRIWVWSWIELIYWEQDCNKNNEFCCKMIKVNPRSFFK